MPKTYQTALHLKGCIFAVATLAALGMAGTRSAQAQVVAQFDSPITTVFSPSGAETVTFSGLITNFNSTPVTFTSATIPTYITDSAGDRINLGFDSGIFTGFTTPFAPDTETHVSLVDTFLSANQAPGLYDIASDAQSTANPGTLPLLTLNFSDGEVTNTNFALIVKAAAVPEASTTLSFGLLLALGMGGLGIAAKRKKVSRAV